MCVCAERSLSLVECPVVVPYPPPRRTNEREMFLLVRGFHHQVPLLILKVTRGVLPEVCTHGCCDRDWDIPGRIEAPEIERAVRDGSKRKCGQREVGMVHVYRGSLCQTPPLPGHDSVSAATHLVGLSVLARYRQRPDVDTRAAMLGQVEGQRDPEESV